MIDMHSHCLPALDDGAKDVKTALLMLEDAKKQGCDAVIATPHCKVYSEEELNCAVEARDKSYELLIAEGKNQNAVIPEIKKGFEVYLDKDITVFSSYEKLCIEGTKAMLIEMPMRHWDSLALGRIEVLKEKGITPILAHIERYMSYGRNIEKALMLEGVVYQVNADAFFGWHRKKLIKKLVKMGKTVVVGSDMHNLTTRKSRIFEAYKKAVRKNKSYSTLFNTDITLL